MNTEIPSEAEWGDWRQDPDQMAAHKIYFGKSNADMAPRFIEAPIEVASELQFMPRVPFQYYVLGFRDAVLRRQGDELTVANAASSFVRLVEVRLKSDPQSILQIREDLLKPLTQIAEHQEKYGADKATFGDFSEIVRSIYKEIAAASH